MKNNKRTQHIITMDKHINPLMDKGEEITLKRGTYFMHQGDMPEYCYIVKSGQVVSSETYANGNTRNGLIMDAGSIIGEEYIILDEPCTTNYKAIAETRLVRIKSEKFKEYLFQNQDLYKAILESLSIKFLSTTDEIRNMASRNVTWRICNLIMVFAQRYGKIVDGMVCIDTPLYQHNIAFMLYLNRITVVRVFKKLKARNLLVKIDGLYYITDLKAFKEYMDKTENNDKI